MFGWIETAVNQIGGALGIETRSKTEQNVEKLNQEAFDLEKERWDYEKNLQQTMFQREDNAVQRRVADLKAAGMSPVLAAGQGANAGQEISRSSNPSGALQNQAAAEQAVLDRRMQVANQVMNMIGMFSSISHTQAQTDAINFDMETKFPHQQSMDRQSIALKESLRDIQKGVADEQIAMSRARRAGVPYENVGRAIEALRKGYDLDYSVRMGMRTSDHLSTGVRDLAALGNIFNRTKNQKFSSAVEAELIKVFSQMLGLNSVQGANEENAARAAGRVSVPVRTGSGKTDAWLERAGRKLGGF